GGSGYTRGASSSRLTEPTSPSFNTTASRETQLAGTGSPNKCAAGVAITPAVQVTARDGQGNTATGFTGNVTVAIGANPSGGTLAGTATVAAVSGGSEERRVGKERGGRGWRVGGSRSGLTGPRATALNVTAGKATQADYMS